MNMPKFECGDDVQVLDWERNIVTDSAIVIDVVRLPAPLSRDPGTTVTSDTYGYILHPQVGPVGKCVSEHAMRRRPRPGMAWGAIKIYCELALKP